MSWPCIWHPLFTRRWQGKTFGIRCNGWMDYAEIWRRSSKIFKRAKNVWIEVLGLKDYERFESFCSCAALDTNTTVKWKSGSSRALWVPGEPSHRPKGFCSWPEARGRLVRGRRSLTCQWLLWWHRQFLEDLKSLLTAPWGSMVAWLLDRSA